MSNVVNLRDPDSYLTISREYYDLLMESYNTSATRYYEQNPDLNTYISIKEYCNSVGKDIGDKLSEVEEFFENICANYKVKLFLSICDNKVTVLYPPELIKDKLDIALTL